MLRARADEIASSVIDGEATLINLTTRIYYALEGVGGDVWTALMSGSTPGLLTSSLAERYGHDEAEIAGDLGRLLDELLAEGLIEVVDGDPPGETPWRGEAASALPGPYVPPILQRFDDMQAQLALDPPLPMPPETGVR